MRWGQYWLRNHCWCRCNLCYKIIENKKICFPLFCFIFVLFLKFYFDISETFGFGFVFALWFFSFIFSVRHTFSKNGFFLLSWIFLAFFPRQKWFSRGSFVWGFLCCLLFCFVFAFFFLFFFGFALFLFLRQRKKPRRETRKNNKTSKKINYLVQKMKKRLSDSRLVQWEWFEGGWSTHQSNFEWQLFQPTQIAQNLSKFLQNRKFSLFLQEGVPSSNLILPLLDFRPAVKFLLFLCWFHCFDVRLVRRRCLLSRSRPPSAQQTRTSKKKKKKTNQKKQQERKLYLKKKKKKKTSKKRAKKEDGFSPGNFANIFRISSRSVSRWRFLFKILLHRIIQRRICRTRFCDFQTFAQRVNHFRDTRFGLEFWF